jgi:large subunit ribosomal protein L24
MYNRVRINLDSDLRKKFGVRSYAVTIGDIVKVKSGQRKGEGGKVISVDHRNGLVSVEGITSVKEDGKQKELFLRPADLRITRLDFSRHQRYEHLREIAAMKNVVLSEEPPEQPAPPEAHEEAPVEVDSEETNTESNEPLLEDKDTEAEADENQPEDESEEESDEEDHEEEDVEDDQ